MFTILKVRSSIGSSKVIEHSSHITKIEGLNSAQCGREGLAQMDRKWKVRIFGKL